MRSYVLRPKLVYDGEACKGSPVYSVIESKEASQSSLEIDILDSGFELLLLLLLGCIFKYIIINFMNK